MAGWWARLVAHDDPLMRAANVVALMLATNQPTYPLYLWLAVGEGWWHAWIVLPSVPFFAAVPLLGRRRPLLGRLLLAAVSIANVVASSLALGSQAGLSVLLLPCAALGAMLFRARERWAMLGIVGASMVAWLALADRPGSLFEPAQYAAIARLNALSGLALVGFLGALVDVTHRQ
ncbi:MAG: hypothetical protein ABS99_00295 [Acetobacteraceae bacterium SCN 69-10]|nr:hypothetical protein [Rhodospirillales bacterium]ODU62532.1 MAG: hypothetical protein ABS99_00295 [Acetobacteraceae bacterium SCN 69-10]OJY76844.1 MAG: hypothetical protein BGP12_05185 [Rhodospirillales bacterium 70-18]